MTRKRHTHHSYQVARRSSAADAMPLVNNVATVTVQDVGSLLKRADTSTASPTGSCGPHETTGRCERDSSANSQLPLVLGIVIPLVGAILVLVFLHRRHLKKLAKEDVNDPHKSLDFGLDPAIAGKGGKKGKRGGPEMVSDHQVTEKGLRGRGMSMEMGMGHPYLLPPELHNSRESLQSLSRSIQSGDDRYGRNTTFIPGDGSSVKSFPTSPRRSPDDSSIYTKSSGGRDNMNQELLKNAGGMPHSTPPQRNASLPDKESFGLPAIEVSQSSLHEIPRKGLPSNPKDGGLQLPATGEENRDSYIDRDGGDMRRSNNYLAGFINTRASSIEPHSHPDAGSINYQSSEPGNYQAVSLTDMPTPLPQDTEKRRSPPGPLDTLPSNPRPVRTESVEASSFQISKEPPQLDTDSDYGEAFKVTPPSPGRSSHPNIPYINEPEPPYGGIDDYGSSHLAGPGIDSHRLSIEPSFDNRRLSLSIRPLPREEPTDTPEQRANRIRSFYKEYFDDSKPAADEIDIGGNYDGNYDGNYGEDYGGNPHGYYEDYDQNYMGQYQDDAAAIFDPETGNFIVSQTAPYAEPITRRAMTPPPRAPPRFQGQMPHRGQQSMSGFMPPGPRAYSSASGRMGPPGRRPPPKALPPPSPLRVLPTPHMLKEDAFALPIDFAPPSTYKDRAVGRPESPLGGLRNYSRAVPVHTPLASAFDELAVVPSPHALRKSGTYTALDFAPPPRFKTSDTGSDAGSIRSNRTGVSAAHLNSIRAGAYRVSRLPTDMVGTRDDLATSLKPTWGLRPHGS